MPPFFTVKNASIIGGIILSFSLSHLFFEEEYYYEVVGVDPEEDLDEIDEETTEPTPAEEQ